MLRKVFLLFFAILNCSAFLKAEGPQVDLPVGSLVGRERITATGVTYYSYQGIPFAEPPIGKLRFQAPIEKKPWKDVLDATHERSPCYQIDVHEPEEREDCLFINVYTPAKPSSNASLPVMFWIYGGAFLNGMATEMQFGADHLVARDVIVVEANYRLGPLGFLSFGDDVVPGNAGLKDQSLALLWTNKYIEYFGGDPTKVTIFGCSAGSVSVSYHLLSPLSRGLFSGAILESGSALSAWAINRNQTAVSRELARMINEEEYANHNHSSESLLNYLQSKSADEIKAASYKIEGPIMSIQHGFYFAPVVEGEHPGAFFSKKHYVAFETGDVNRVPIMLGFASEEEIVIVSNPDRHLLAEVDSDWTHLIPLDMNEKRHLRKEIGAEIHQHYSPNETFLENPTNFAKYLTDQSFVRAIHKQAQLQSKYGNVWLYRFAYMGTMTPGVPAPVHGFSPDVGHGAELCYIFACKDSGLNTTDVSLFPKEDILVHDRLVTLWTNFAKYNNPTPVKDGVLQNITWPVFKADTEAFLDIGSDLGVKNYPRKENIAFWENLYEKYGVPPYDTY